MEQITVRVTESTLEELEAEADEHDVTRSEHIRQIIDDRNDPGADVERLREEAADYEAECGRLRDRVAELETDVDRLQNEKRLILEDREEKQELVAFAEAERDVVERREQRERERESAGVVTRAKWWLVGRDVDESEN